MKVLFVDQFGKTTGRDTLALAELINQDKEVDMTVYLSDNTEIPSDRNYTVDIKTGFHGAYEGSFLNKATNYIKALKELKREIRDCNYDVVHLQWFSLPWIEWIYVGSIAKKHKVVVTVHDVIPFDNRPMEMKCLDKIYTRANALIMHTKSGKELFRKTYRAKTPITVVGQKFCLKSDYTRIDNKEAKKHFGIPEDAVVYLYYGTIRPSKGLDILIKSIHAAHKENEKIYLLAAGAFHKVNEEEYRNLVKEQLDMSFSTVNFGFVPQEEEQWYFSAADVVVLPYLEVTQSGVAQLGLMYELPLIATDIGEMADVCKDGQNGMVIKPGDSESIRNAIVKMAADEIVRKKMSETSKTLAETEFSLKYKAMRIRDTYYKLMGTSK